MMMIECLMVEKVGGEKRTESERDGIASKLGRIFALTGQFLGKGQKWEGKWARARQEEFGNEPVQIGLMWGVDITSL